MKENSSFFEIAENNGFIDLDRVECVFVSNDESCTKQKARMVIFFKSGEKLTSGFDTYEDAIREKDKILKAIRKDPAEKSFNERLERIALTLYEDIETTKSELRSLIKDTVGFTTVAAIAEIDRTQLSRTLGEDGNPNLTLFCRILKAVKHAVQESEK